MVDSSADHLSSVTSNHVEDFVVEFDIQKFIVLLIDYTILVASF